MVMKSSLKKFASLDHKFLGKAGPSPSSEASSTGSRAEAIPKAERASKAEDVSRTEKDSTAERPPKVDNVRETESLKVEKKEKKASGQSDRSGQSKKPNSGSRKPSNSTNGEQSPRQQSATDRPTSDGKVPTGIRSGMTRSSQLKAFPQSHPMKSNDHLGVQRSPVRTTSSTSRGTAMQKLILKSSTQLAGRQSGRSGLQPANQFGAGQSGDKPSTQKLNGISRHSGLQNQLAGQQSGQSGLQPANQLGAWQSGDKPSTQKLNGISRHSGLQNQHKNNNNNINKNNYNNFFYYDSNDNINNSNNNNNNNNNNKAFRYFPNICKSRHFNKNFSHADGPPESGSSAKISDVSAINSPPDRDKGGSTFRPSQTSYQGNKDGAERVSKAESALMSVKTSTAEDASRADNIKEINSPDVLEEGKKTSGQSNRSSQGKKSNSEDEIPSKASKSGGSAEFSKVSFKHNRPNRDKGGSIIGSNETSYRDKEGACGCFLDEEEEKVGEFSFFFFATESFIFLGGGLK